MFAITFSYRIWPPNPIRKPWTMVGIAIQPYLLVGFAFLAVALLCPTDARAQVTYDSILQAWKSRQARVHAFRFHWTETKTIAAGTMPPKKDVPGASRVPERDAIITLKCLLKASGERMYYRTLGPHWLPEREEFVQQEYISSYDGREGRVYFSEALGKANRSGFISQKAQSPDFDNSSFEPITMAIWPFHPKLGRFKVLEWSLTSNTAILGDHRCLVLERAKGLFNEFCWVDPGRGFIPLRFLRHYNNKVNYQINFGYASDSTVDWLPNEWSVTIFEPTGVRMSMTCSAKVDEYELNPSFGGNEFELTFPPGTDVSDFKGNARYIVREKGDKRIVTRDEMERSATYDELLKSESGMAGLLTEKHSVVLYLALSFAFLAVTLALFLLVKRRLQIRSRGSAP